MMKKFLCIAVAITLHLFSFAQDDSLKIKNDSLSLVDTTIMISQVQSNLVRKRIYTLKPSIDIPVFAAGAGWSGYAFTKIYSKDRSSEETILSLNKDDINWFDRWAVRRYSVNMGKYSNYIFYGSMTLPFLFWPVKKQEVIFSNLVFCISKPCR